MHVDLKLISTLHIYFHVFRLLQPSRGAHAPFTLILRHSDYLHKKLCIYISIINQESQFHETYTVHFIIIPNITHGPCTYARPKS